MTDSIFVKYMKTKTFRNIPATLRWLQGEYKVEKREKEGSSSRAAAEEEEENWWPGDY